MSMPYVQTIDQEANVLVKLATDLDKYRRYYSLKEVDTDETIFVKFVAPKIIAFEDYRFYLLKNSDTKPLSPANYYRPDYVSYQEYGTVNLWAMLLFINDIPTIEDFEKELNEVADKILLFGTNIENYPIGQIDDLFNSKKQACLREIAKRKKLDSVTNL